jgi:hypothetical protein
MSIKDKKMIDVINYYSFGISFKAKDHNYWIDGVKDNIPHRIPLLIDEIQYIDTTSQAFKSGLLFFDEDIEQEVYEDILRIPQWRNILKPSKIKEIILKPTIEGLEQFLNVKSITVFDIIRGIFVDLKYNENADISTRVERIITERHKELLNKVYNTNIILKPKDVVGSSEDVNTLKAQNETMQSELKAMKEMLAQFMATQNKTDDAKPENNTETVPTVPKEKPKKSKKVAEE